MDSFPHLASRYRVILCDLWGVVHDGYAVFPGVVERLWRWKDEGRTVLFLTNAPRSPNIVARELIRFGIPGEVFDGVMTAGEAGVTELSGRPVGFVGTAADRADLVERGLTLIDEGFDEVACAGLTEDRPEVADFAAELREWSARAVILHCLNPDRVVIHGDQRMVCAGALADAYRELGGTVHSYGKPYPEVYREAFRLAGNPDRSAVLAVGDGLHTDMLGAALQGIDAVYVTSGVHAGEPFPADFGEQHGTGRWVPIATVASIGA
jgi:HAD superfamily hydrolase (TIGR01459 family)